MEKIVNKEITLKRGAKEDNKMRFELIMLLSDKIKNDFKELTVEYFAENIESSPNISHSLNIDDGMIWIESEPNDLLFKVSVDEDFEDEELVRFLRILRDFAAKQNESEIETIIPEVRGRSNQCIEPCSIIEEDEVIQHFDELDRLSEAKEYIGFNFIFFN